MMILAHQMHHGATGIDATIITVAAVAGIAAAAYLAAATSQRANGNTWSNTRTVSFLGGLTVAVVAFVPQLSPYTEGTFTAHMWQHLLIGMVAPLGIVLAAPITLTLRTLPTEKGRRLMRVLRSMPARILGRPGAALMLNLGGLAVLYFSPLYNQVVEHAALHHLIHLHFFLAGTLFAWVIAGPDPAPHRPSVPKRLVVLGIAIAGHAVLSQLLYADLYTPIDVPPADLQAGGSLMYFGGDIAELALALALLTNWRPQHHTPRPARTRAAAPG